MGKFIRTVFKNDTLSLVECNDGYFLYDTIIGMNIVMRAKCEQDAFVEALLYYQKSLTEVKKNYMSLNEKIGNFITQLNQDDY